MSTPRRPNRHGRFGRGDRVELTLGEWRREVVVKALADRRGPAAEARALYEDLRRRRLGRCALRAVARAPGLGRPTKRERRLRPASRPLIGIARAVRAVGAGGLTLWYRETPVMDAHDRRERSL